MRGDLMTAEDVCHACYTIGFMRGETPEDVGQNFSDPFPHAARYDGIPGRVELGFNEAEDSAAGELAIVQDRRVFSSCRIGSIQAPVARDDIHSAISIQISRGDSIPPTGQVVKRRACSSVAKVMED